MIAQQTSTNNFTKIDYPGATGTDVTRINDAGQIVGYYYDSSGNTHGFLLPSGSTEITTEFGSMVAIISIIHNCDDNDFEKIQLSNTLRLGISRAKLIPANCKYK